MKDCILVLSLDFSTSMPYLRPEMPPLFNHLYPRTLLLLYHSETALTSPGIFCTKINHKLDYKLGKIPGRMGLLTQKCMVKCCCREDLEFTEMLLTLNWTETL